jgi:hypothetical protein
VHAGPLVRPRRIECSCVVAIPELTTLGIFSIELVAARIGHYLLTIGKGNSLCYHPSIPAGLEEWVFAHYLRPHSFSFFPPPKLHNTIRSLTKFKQLARTRYKCAIQCQTVSDFIWRIRVYYTRHFLCIRAELSIIEGSCLRPRQDAKQMHRSRHALPLRTPSILQRPSSIWAGDGPAQLRSAADTSATPA